jgi:Leucine-rich repeat (LRR) protein
MSDSYPNNTDTVNFDTNYPPYRSSKQILDRLDELNENLKKLSFVQCDIQETHLVSLSKLTNLEKLKIHQANLNGKLKYIAKLTNLKSLELTLAHINDDDIRDLSSLVNLEEFRLINSENVTGSGFETWKNCTKLKTLEVSYCSLTDTGMLCISQSLPNVDNLNIRFNSCCDKHKEKQSTFTNEAIKHISTMPLTYLNIMSDNITEITPLSNIKMLTELRLYSSTILVFGNTFPQVKTLYVTNNIVKDLVKNISDWQQLEFLHIGSFEDNLSLSNLSVLTNLTTLELVHSNVNDSDLSFLSELTKLQNIDLRCNKRVGDGVLVLLYPLTELKELNLYYSKVTKCGETELRTYLPDLKIYRGHNDSDDESD